MLCRVLHRIKHRTKQNVLFSYKICNYNKKLYLFALTINTFQLTENNVQVLYNIFSGELMFKLSIVYRTRARIKPPSNCYENDYLKIKRNLRYMLREYRRQQ